MAGNGMKSLAKDTAIYGLSSILGRLINWCLVPLHISIFTDTVEYGKISRIYGLTALFLVLLTYGMETGFFRFMNKKEENADKVYSTSLITLAISSLLFILFCISFIHPISEILKYTDHREHIMIMAMVVAIDAFMTIPFAYLRYQKRPKRFAYLKLASIIIYVLFNVFFLITCPWMQANYPDFILSKFYHPEIGIGYVFLANLISSLAVLILLIPSAMKGLKIYFDKKLLNRLLKYSFPLLILGLAGVINQAVAPLVYPYIFDSVTEAERQLGIYNACLKFTVIITMFIQAFRYAYEPFIFSKNKEEDNRKPYADAMKYFVIFTLFIFLGIMFYIDILQYIMDKIGKNYAIGLMILPIAMMGEIFFGIYYNLSVWYKLTDKTKYGAYFSVFGCAIQVSLNIIFVPIIGFMASAWATLICNIVICAISYFIGQKHYPIKYNLKDIFIYLSIALVLYAIAMYPEIENNVLRIGYRSILLVGFALLIVKRDLPLNEIPIINKFFIKKKDKLK